MTFLPVSGDVTEIGLPLSSTMGIGGVLRPGGLPRGHRRCNFSSMLDGSTLYLVSRPDRLQTGRRELVRGPDRCRDCRTANRSIGHR